jgi:ABC-type transporter Mla subunit MlaD
MIIRPKSPLGLKYLQITPGNSSENLAAGETIPLAQARPEPVDIDQFFDMFNEETRTNIQRNLTGFGNAFAGRGPQLNEAFGTLRKLAESSQPVLRSLVAPSTNFSGFWRALENISATVAPVALTNSELFVALDRTFAAFARVSRPFIQETISKSPPFLEAAETDLPVLGPFLNDSARFFTAFEPGTKALADTSPTINAALRSGVPALNQSPKLFAQLEPTADALLSFQEAPGVNRGLNLLIDANELLKPPIRFFAPAQTVCNYLTIAFRNLADIFSETNGVANWAGALANEGPSGPNAETMPASAPANGPEKENHLHANLYPNTAAPGQTHECEAGNVRYAKGVTTIGNVPGNQGTRTSGQIAGQGGGG